MSHELRQAQRFPIQESTTFVVRGKKYQAKVVDESSLGALLSVAKPVRLKSGQTVEVLLRGAWFLMDVRHCRQEGTQMLVGLERLETKLAPTSDRWTRSYSERPGARRNRAIACVLLSIVVAMSFVICLTLSSGNPVEILAIQLSEFLR